MDKAYKLSPLAETAWLLADAQTLAGDEAAARATVAELEKRGKQTDPRTLGLFWATRNEHVDEAVTLLAEEKKHRGDIATLDAYAWALHRAGKDKEAQVESDRAMRLGTREAPLLFHAGAIKLALGKTAEAKKLLEAAVKLKSALDLHSAKEAEARLAEAEKAKTP
jgi:tetratricopeptide (TPR) repeat protein